VIYLHMVGAPSQLDLFDPKPELRRRDGELCPESLLRGRRFAFLGDRLRLGGSRFAFQRCGKSGLEVSELLPSLQTVVDEITVVRSVRTDEINHAPAQMFLHSGFGRGGHPSLGAWASYGLGSENQDLPAYVVLLSGPPGGAGAGMWSAGFLPSVHQGVQFRATAGQPPIYFLENPSGHSRADRRRVLDAITELDRRHYREFGDPETAARLRQYETAFRMQASVPELADLSGESRFTLEAYGLAGGTGAAAGEGFARNCLLARRLVERGVRMVELYDSDWDHHADLDRRLSQKAREVDRPIAALLRDLRQRGLLEDTLVVWGAEFGRTPLRQVADTGTALPGRDHHRDAFTVWLAGAGVRRGFAFGQTDDLGFEAAENAVHVHDLNATLLHLLGLDHRRLTYRYQGRDFRLTDVHGAVVNGILA
jgi:hypothetical protein